MFNQPPDSDRLSQGSAYHFFGTTRPALIFARIRNRNGQIIAAAITSMIRTGRATHPVVPAAPAYRPDVVEDAKLWTHQIIWRQLNSWLWTKFFRHFESIDEPPHFVLRDLS